jgi:membrane fusion protein (multidrug efflux system)
MTKRMLLMLGFVALLAASLAGGFLLHIEKLKAAAPHPGPQTVSTIRLQPLAWQPGLNAVGTINAVNGVNVTTEVAGMVREVRARSGQDVRAGQVLVQLNADADAAQLRSLQASADLAATVLKRDRAQMAAEAVSQALIDNDNADLSVKQALVAQQAALLAKKTIRAPFSGRLGILNVNAGQYLTPGDKIVSLQALDSVHVDFSLPQDQLRGLAPGQVVNVSTSTYGNEIFAGKLSAISPKIDPSTRSILVEATVSNPGRRLLPGMFARATVDVGQEQRHLTLPQSAITYNPYGSTVFVVGAAGHADAGNAASAPARSTPAAGARVVRQVFVTTGETRGDQVAIVKGLQEGDEVVTSGQLKLRNGSPVLIDNSVQPANSPSPQPQEQ